MSRLIVVGAGGHGRVVADAAELAGRWSSICFVDDRYPELRAVDGFDVVGSAADAFSLMPLGPDDQYVVAIGAARRRIEVLDALGRRGCRIATIIHPSASVSARATLDAGCMVLAGACINTGARLSRGVIVNTGATVDHDCALGEGVHVCPGAHLAGDVKIGRLSWVGIGAAVRHGITIADEVTIGAGAAVVSPLPAGCVAVGVPAKPRLFE